MEGVFKARGEGITVITLCNYSCERGVRVRGGEGSQRCNRQYHEERRGRSAETETSTEYHARLGIDGRD